MAILKVRGDAVVAGAKLIAFLLAERGHVPLIRSSNFENPTVVVIGTSYEVVYFASATDNARDSLFLKVPKQFPAKTPPPQFS